MLRRWWAAEVVQTSGMDCGPAALKCLLEGFGIAASYGRLREACQTGVDGTSIDTLEAVARQLGLDAEQVLIPVDHVCRPEAGALPAIAVVRLPSGLTHFVVLWRRHGGVLQVMDPATGRRWPSVEGFLGELYVHAVEVPEEAWAEFSESAEFRRALAARLRGIGAGQGIEGDMAALDAAVRLTEWLVRSGGVRRGRDAGRVVEKFAGRPALIPERYWFAGRAGEGERLMRGAVLVRVRGRIAASADLPRELAAAIAERPPKLFSGIPPVVVMGAMAVAAIGTMAEAVLLRGLFDLGPELGLAGQRVGAVAAILVFSGALLALDWSVFSAVLRMGRRLENRLRVRFLEKIPRLGDRYFQSRLTSDMAERSHTTQRLRHLPDIGRQLLRAIFELAATAAGVIWLAPESAPFVLLAVGAAVVPPFALQSVLGERDLRVRSHAAGLVRYYLDAMLGLVAVRAHGAERALRRQHEALLVEWAGAAFSLQRLAVGLEAFQLCSIFGLVGWLMLGRLGNSTEVGRTLLMVYWALNIPALGQDIGTLARQLPYYRNLTLRLLEPLGAPEEVVSSESERVGAAPSIEFRGVRVEASGHTILEGVDLAIPAGAHIGILGRSGAGKSSLVGILLGWLRASDGQVLVDGRPLDCEALRRVTAWVDPAVQLWNRSLIDNLLYGSGAGSRAVEAAVDAASLREVLETLPSGMQTPLGESGALLSGGQGQRVRLGRALLRAEARLVILDEPFRGLDRGRRRELLAKTREHWRSATLLCITHDVDETRGFDRVLVIEGGRVVEDGDPAVLAGRRDSRYARLLDAETDVRTALWSGDKWRKFRVEGGKVSVSEKTKPSREDRELMDLL